MKNLVNKYWNMIVAEIFLGLEDALSHIFGEDIVKSQEVRDLAKRLWPIVSWTLILLGIVLLIGTIRLGGEPEPTVEPTAIIEEVVVPAEEFTPEPVVVVPVEPTNTVVPPTNTPVPTEVPPTATVKPTDIPPTKVPATKVPTAVPTEVVEEEPLFTEEEIVWLYFESEDAWQFAMEDNDLECLLYSQTTANNDVMWGTSSRCVQYFAAIIDFEMAVNMAAKNATWDLIPYCYQDEEGVGIEIFMFMEELTPAQAAAGSVANCYD